MARSPSWVLAFALIAGACSVGEGQGELIGRVTALECGLEDAEIDVGPSFFGAELTERTLNIRVQRGSRLESYADGIAVSVRDVNEVTLGEPTAVGPRYLDPVQVIFYLNDTCEAGYPRSFRSRPVSMIANEGTVTFDEVYAPDINPSAVGISARLEGLRFRDRDEGDAMNAELDGWFSFFFQRGAPAQRFP